MYEEILRICLQNYPEEAVKDGILVENIDKVSCIEIPFNITIHPCDFDFLKTNFLEPIGTEEELLKMVDKDSLGREFYSLYEKGAQKTYKFQLFEVFALYPEKCGEIVYEMEIVDKTNIENVFALEGFNMTVNTSLATSNQYFSTALRWTIRNDITTY